MHIYPNFRLTLLNINQISLMRMKKIFLSAIGLLSVAAAVNAQTTILTQDFESGSPPSGWTRTQNTPSVGFEFGTALGSSYFPISAHTRYAVSNDDAHDDNSTAANVADRDRLISPAMDLTPYASSGVVATFAYISPGNYGSTAHVEVSTDGGTTWTNVSTLTPSAAWATANVSLSAYTGSSSVLMCFRHNDNGYWADGFGVDDVTVKSLASNDAAVLSVNNGPFMAAGSVNIEADVMNAGAGTISSVTLEYSIDGGAYVSASMTGLSIASLATSTLTHPTAATLTVGSHNVCVRTTTVNGTTDPVTSNNESCSSISVLSSIPTKRTILEDHTGAWCQFCPDGTVVAEEVKTTYANAIVVAVHNSDAMDIPDGNTISAEYISGYPGGTIDHFYWTDNSSVEQNRGEWVGRVGDRLDMVAPVSVSMSNASYNAATREFTCDVNANWVGSASGDLRLNLYVLEDNCTGTGTGWNQVNYYNTVAGHPYYGAGNPIVGFVHNDVLRAMAGGAWGQSGSVPASVNDGDVSTHTFTTTFDASWDIAEIKIVAVVQRYDSDPNNREIFNSFEEDFEVLTGIDNEVVNGAYVAPNPFNESTSINFTLLAASEVNVTVMDLQGRTVANLFNGNMGSGAQQVMWNGTADNGASAANGVYMVRIQTGEHTLVQKVVLNR
jgi:hypothetical protein